MALLEPVPWWVDHIGIPAFFLLVGSAVGFAAGRLKDYLDARIVLKAFLRAIHVELTTLRKHLEGTLKDATEVRDLLQKGVRKALHLATTFQIGVYTSQLGKIRDVADPVVLEIIRFYDQLSNLERIKSHTAARSFELTVLPKSAADTEREQSIALDYASSLEEVIKRINQLIPAADSLMSKLPPR
jgi:hypothetical protein